MPEEKPKARKGWEEAGRREKARQEAMARGSVQIFSLVDKEKARIRFLHSEPYPTYIHWNQAANRYFTCLDAEHMQEEGYEPTCPMCKVGAKPQYKSAWFILDFRNWKDDKEVVHSGAEEPRLARTSFGLVVTTDLHSKDGNKPLTEREFIVERIGSGMETVYSFDGTDFTDLKIPDEILELIYEEGVLSEKKMDELMAEQLAPLGEEAIEEAEGVEDFDKSQVEPNTSEEPF